MLKANKMVKMVNNFITYLKHPQCVHLKKL